MKFFKSLKNWQLFLIFISPVLMPSLMQHSSNPMLIFMVVWICWMAIFILWMQSIGLGSNEKLSNELKRKTIFFKIAAVVPIAYGVLLLASGFPQELSPNSAPPFWLIPLHLFSMFCMFYMLWFSSKQLGTLKQGNKTTFMDYAGIFFLTWFFPIGVWFVQPLVNKLLVNENV